eukprot:1161288-Pelagomonas_calceolata.AAC.6
MSGSISTPTYHVLMPGALTGWLLRCAVLRAGAEAFACPARVEGRGSLAQACTNTTMHNHNVVFLHTGGFSAQQACSNAPILNVEGSMAKPCSDAPMHNNNACILGGQGSSAQACSQLHNTYTLP